MPKIAIVLFLLCGGLYYGATVFSGCPPSWTLANGTFGLCPDSANESRTWRIVWQDGGVTNKSNFGNGQCCSQTECYPIFNEPRSYPTTIGGSPHEEWAQTTYDRRCNGSSCENDGLRTQTVTRSCRIFGGGGCLSGLTTSGEPFKEGDSAELCSPCNPDQSELDACWQSGGTYDYNSCQCGASPIVIDVLGNGFDLTNAQNGVDFDINGDGTQDRIAWSSANSDDAWLALDRNGNGLIDNGKELFGNSTQQPAPPAGELKNGFLALAKFDKVANGGNADGKINRLDAVFDNLRLWQDLNHNGVSEANELKTLTDVGLAKIDLDYQESRRTDEFGNRFKYRAKVRDTQDAQLGRWAWDVYLVVELPNN